MQGEHQTANANANQSKSKQRQVGKKKGNQKQYKKAEEQSSNYKNKVKGKKLIEAKAEGNIEQLEEGQMQIKAEQRQSQKAIQDSRVTVKITTENKVKGGKENTRQKEDKRKRRQSKRQKNAK